MTQSSIVEYVKEWLDKHQHAPAKSLQQDKDVARNRGSDPVKCNRVRYNDMFFDLDDTLVGTYQSVNRVDALETLNNLQKTRERCGIPRLHVVSANSKNNMFRTMKKNGIVGYFDSAQATGSNKSEAIATKLKEHNTKQEDAIMIGHDLEYDFLPIKANRQTRNVHSRMIKPNLSVYDGRLNKEEEAMLKGFCFVDGIGWKHMKSVVKGSDGCVEDIALAEQTGDDVAVKDLIGGGIKINYYSAGSYEPTKEETYVPKKTSKKKKKAWKKQTQVDVWNKIDEEIDPWADYDKQWKDDLAKYR